jgi:hypothetical protein
MKYDKKISFAGNDATGIVIVDAQTGVMTDYKLLSAKWLTESFNPINLIKSNDWGEYEMDIGIFERQ